MREVGAVWAGDSAWHCRKPELRLVWLDCANLVRGCVFFAYVFNAKEIVAIRAWEVVADGTLVSWWSGTRNDSAGNR